MVLTDDIKDAHGHQVLHVSFSHNGKMFATCSKDGFVIVSYLLIFYALIKSFHPFASHSYILFGIIYFIHTFCDYIGD